jgi:hypothetical protein
MLHYVYSYRTLLPNLLTCCAEIFNSNETSSIEMALLVYRISAVCSTLEVLEVRFSTPPFLLPPGGRKILSNFSTGMIIERGFLSITKLTNLCFAFLAEAQSLMNGL